MQYKVCQKENRGPLTNQFRTKPFRSRGLGSSHNVLNSRYTRPHTQMQCSYERRAYQNRSVYLWILWKLFRHCTKTITVTSAEESLWWTRRIWEKCIHATLEGQLRACNVRNRNLRETLQNQIITLHRGADILPVIVMVTALWTRTIVDRVHLWILRAARYAVLLSSGKALIAVSWASLDLELKQLAFKW